MSWRPIAQAIVAAARERGLPLPIPGDVVETPGEGLAGKVNNKSVLVGGSDFVTARVERAAVDHAPTAAGAVLVALAIDGGSRHTS
jgi:cation transport ATPase